MSRSRNKKRNRQNSKPDNRKRMNADTGLEEVSDTDPDEEIEDEADIESEAESGTIAGTETEIPEEIEIAAADEAESEDRTDTGSESEEVADPETEPAMTSGTEPAEGEDDVSEVASRVAASLEDTGDSDKDKKKKTLSSQNGEKKAASKNSIKAEAEARERREIRRKRRVRNQIIAYVSVSLVIIALGIGISFGLHKLVTFISEKREEVREEMTEQTEDTQDQEEVVVTAPETPETEVSEEEVIEEEVEELTPDDYLEEMVTSTISQMPIEDKVAQLFIVTPEALTGVNAATQAGEGTREALTNYAVGGLIYDKKNIESDEQLSQLLGNTKSMSKYELFLGVREPGGESSTLSGSSLNDIPSVESPSAIAASGDASGAYNAGVTISSYLSYYGINLDLAPNGSVTADEGSVSADVSYGSDETSAYEMISRMIEGLQSGKVNACMTDFPGTGNITEDTAKGRVESDLSPEDISAQIVPYITGVAAGAGFIQLNNVTYINADSEAMPASLSKYMVETVLRDSMGYDGVVISGPLNEAAVTEYYTSGEAALYAYAAGVDMICMPEDFNAAYEALLAAVQDGTVPESRIDQSLERIFRIKLAGYVE